MVTNKKVAFNATTNGTLLDSEKIAFIRDNEISVMVSLDGPKEIYDAQRPFKSGKDSYVKIFWKNVLSVKKKVYEIDTLEMRVLIKKTCIFFLCKNCKLRSSPTVCLFLLAWSPLAGPFGRSSRLPITRIFTCLFGCIC